MDLELLKELIEEAKNIATIRPEGLEVAINSIYEKHKKVKLDFEYIVESILIKEKTYYEPAEWYDKKEIVSLTLYYYDDDSFCDEVASFIEDNLDTEYK